MCGNCRQRIKTNPLRLLDCKSEKCQATKEEAPDAISFLNTSSKKHFKEVLEYLDAMEVTYEINNELVRGLDYYTQTVFEIIDAEEVEKIDTEDVTKEEADNEETEEKDVEKAKKNKKEEAEAEYAARPVVLVGGGRYDLLAKQLGHKKEIPSVGASMGVDRVIKADAHKPISPRIQKKARVFFIQLGFEAKLKSLTVVEILRKARIPIMHSLAKDRLSAQLAVAEKLQIPYTILLGQREALDNTVIVRNMNTRSQETISIEKLPEYIKKKLK